MEKKEYCAIPERNTLSSPDTGSISDDETELDGHIKTRPIGVFWDIENCQVPRGKSATAVAQAVRSQFFKHYREVEFVVVCDATKEHPRILEELNYAQVNLIHVSATCKNAADDKLRQLIRHFGETYQSGAAIVLISGDINFSTDLIELRHRRLIHVILLHNENASQNLLICANEHYFFSDVVDMLPPREGLREELFCVDLYVSNLPMNESSSRIKARLKYLCNNVGGRVGITSQSCALIRFPTFDHALRAQHRMNGQDVFGNKILVSQPQPRGTEFSRTPGRNRPPTNGKNSQPPLVPKPTNNNIQMSNIHWPCTSPKVSNIENLRVRQINNDLRPTSALGLTSESVNFLPKSQGRDRLNNQCFAGENFGLNSKPGCSSSTALGVSSSSYSMVLQRRSANNIDYDSSSGTYDEDSEGELIPRKIGHYGNTESVDLRVTGLDPQLDINLTKSLLAESLNKITKILNLSVFKQWDGSVVASVKVKSMSDAQLVISRLQRARFGSQRIKIAFPTTCPEQIQRFRSQVVDLLAELGNKKLPLSRFKELFYNRFLTNVSVSELRRMSDLCLITEEDGTRMISSNIWNRKCPKTLMTVETKDNPYCRKHFNQTQDVTNLPKIIIGFVQLSERIQDLLKSHNGVLPMATLHFCYTAQFGPLNINEKDGVSLEHLVSCIPNIDIRHSHSMLKFLEWADNEKSTDRSEVLWDRNLTSDLMNLLKSEPRCTIQFQSLIPLYHRRFGKQFRLSDFGHTKLLDLLESLPHIVQVLGFGMTKLVTLSHKAQMKRFRNDVVKLIKNDSNKIIDLAEFADKFLKFHGREFHTADYGLCDLQDLLTQSNGEFKLIKTENGRTLLSIPLKERTLQEIELTETFKSEVIEVLKIHRDCSIPFNKFIPAYHNLLGRQCRVSSYGFFKLIDLFEAISDVATVEESSLGEKVVMLTLNERLKVLGERLINIINWEGGRILLSDLEIAYEYYDYGGLEPLEYDCDCLETLLKRLVNYVKMVDTPQGCLIIAQTPIDSKTLNLRIRFILLDNPRLTIEKFRELYRKQYFGDDIDIELEVSCLPKVVIIGTDTETGQKMIELQPGERFANMVYQLLADERDGALPLVNFETAFARKFGRPCHPNEFGVSTVSALLTAFPEMFNILSQNSVWQPRILALNPSIAEVGYFMPASSGDFRAISQLPPQQQASNNSGSAIYTSDGLSQKLHCMDLMKPSGAVYDMWTCKNPIVSSPITAPEANEVPMPKLLLALNKNRRNRIAAQFENKN